MWCSQCHQDVPAVAHAASGRLVCSRCQRPMARTKAASSTPICDEGIALDERAAAVATAAPPIRTDDWSARKRSRELERKLRRPSGICAISGSSTPHGARRFDPPQNLFDQIEHVTTPATLTGTSLSTTATPSRSHHAASRQIFAWLVVALGTIALLAGVGLIAWSLSANQMKYWNLAIGLALGGQGGLILGLVTVVSRLWRNSRFAANKLQEVHARLAQLQHTTDALTAMRAGGAPAFYADLVRGASPQMLLSNLKGQLDQLATRVGSG